MSAQTIAIPQGIQFNLRGRKGSAQLHLVMDADHYWLQASPAELSRAAAFLGGHPGIVLTLITRLPAWEACLALDARQGVLPHHLISGDGQEILHLTEGREWDPDLVFEEWRGLLESPQSYMEPEPFMPQAAAIDFLECNWGSPRPLFVCLEREGMGSLLRMADGACLPGSWGNKVCVPADTVFLFRPSLDGILQTIERRMSPDLSRRYRRATLARAGNEDPASGPAFFAEKPVFPTGPWSNA
ncbi:MAG: hypothetical protein Q8K67_11430 [Geothrix sp.]|nr:hypothetical protein [Geothrix sp.]